MGREQEAASEKIACIERLRALAVLSVVVHHINWNLLPLSKEGFYKYFDGSVGVDLFFAISGFVIARSLLPQLESVVDKKHFWSVAIGFWTRRAFRLLPSAWLWLAIILALSIFYNRTGAFGSVSTNIGATVAGILNIANIRFADAFNNYFYGGSFVYWSLSLEEQFYLLFPIVAFLLRRWLPSFLLGTFILMLFFEKNMWGVAFRTEALTLGILLAFIERSSFYRTIEPKAMRHKLLAVVVVTLLLSFLVFMPVKAINLYQQRYTIIAVNSAVLVWLASYNCGYIMPISKISSFAEYIGARSYAIYLIHVPVFYAVRETCFRLQLALPSVVLVMISMGLIIAFAELNYRWIETPLRRRGAILAQRFSGSSVGGQSEPRLSM